MKKVEQTILEPPFGNCFQACVASILEMSLDDVPNFSAMDEWRLIDGEWRIENGDGTLWWKALSKFLRLRGLGFVQIAPPDDGQIRQVGIILPSNLNAIALIDSPRGNWEHAVVYNFHTGRIVWDPYPGSTDTGELLPWSRVNCFEFIFGLPL